MSEDTPVKVSFLSALRREIRAALQPADVAVATVALTIALTGVGSLVAWKLAVILESPVALALMFAAPIVAGAHSARLAGASLLTVMIVAFVVEPGIAGRGLGHALGGICAAAAIISAIAVARVIAGSQLWEAELALNAARTNSRRTSAALSRAGICIVALNKRQAWIEVNEAAWRAFGCDPRVTRLVEDGIPIEDEVASSLMHSGSRESWRMLLGLVKADLAYHSPHPSRANGLLPYETVLYSISGDPARYRFRVSVNEDNELTFIGTPSLDAAVDQELVTRMWLSDLVNAIDEPAAILLADGGVLTANWDFYQHAGRVKPGTRVFDIPAVTGVHESTFSASVWSPTRLQASRLPLSLRGVGEGIGARVAPPGSPHLEAVLLVFRPHEEDAEPFVIQHGGE